MLDAIRAATKDLARFLEAEIPLLSDDWWDRHVVDRLSFQQQRTVTERGHKALPQLDFAALLRVLDQNWYELSNLIHLPREGRTWVKEMRTVRNKWAHLSLDTMPASELYRDADTLGRLLGMIGAERSSLDLIESMKASAMAGSGVSTAQNPSVGARKEVSESVARSVSSFKVGDVVALRSDPSIHLPVLEVIKGGPECRYRVFQNGSNATYYDSQLQAIAAPRDDRERVDVDDLHAHLTALRIQSPSTTSLFSLRSGRVQFVPYQYRPVLKLIRADRPRLLIADEVGVGKTIEAGLIIKELRARVDIASVLVICPKALVAERKWEAEMKRFELDPGFRTIG